MNHISAAEYRKGAAKPEQWTPWGKQPLRDAAMIRIELPYPPSAWELYTGWGKTRRLSNTYRKWREDCGYFIRARNEKPIAVPFACSIALERPNKRQDVDNRTKACLDVLQHYGVIKNDNLAERVTIEWATGLPAPCVVLLFPADVEVVKA